MIEFASIAFGVCGLLFGIHCYRELWKWAKMCQNARIVIGFKRRAQIQAPLVEWLQWCNQLTKDEASKGRTVYRNGGVSVSIFRPEIDKPVRTALARVRNARKRRKTPT